MSILSDILFGKDPSPTGTNRRWDEQIDKSGEGASDAESMFQKQMRQFDPAESFQKYASGAQAGFQKQLGLNLRDLAGKAVGQGRFNSGFYDEDQGQVMRDMSADFSNNMNTKALEVTGMQQQQGQFMGNYALQKQGLYDDMLSGQLDRETAANNAKRQQRGSFVNGLLNGAAKAFAGGAG